MGTGLSVVMCGPEGVPVVIPTVLLDALGAAYREVMAREGGPKPFPGGDHLHAILEQSPAIAAAVKRANLRLL